DARSAYASAPPPDSLESALDHNICNEADIRGFYHWAPKERIVGGTTALETFLDHVRDGQPFNGTYVAIDSEVSTATEQHLALCKVLRVGSVAGPPTDCVTVAIVTPADTWLRTLPLERDENVCPTAGSIRLSGAIDLDFDVVTASGLVPLSRSLLHVLQSDLKLSAEQEVSMNNGVAESIEIRSAAPLRNSEILTGG